jgi:hypothetical protein
MAEQLIHSILLALHNIALAACAAAPFYNRQLVVTRGQYGPKLHYELDKVVEDTLRGNTPYCIVFITTLWFTSLAVASPPRLVRGLASHGLADDAPHSHVALPERRRRRGPGYELLDRTINGRGRSRARC